MPARQTTEELIFISDYWFANLAPKGLLNNDINGPLIHDEIIRRGNTVLSFELMSDIVRSLGDRLQYEGAPAPPATKEPATKEWRRGPRPATKVDVHSERDQFVKDLYDINTPLFQRTQEEAKLELDKAIDCASTTYNSRGRVDHALTTHRREQLKAIRIVHPDKNAKGQEVVLYTEMLAEVQGIAKEYDREDARRNGQV